MQTLQATAERSVQELLPQHPLFHDLPARHLATLAAVATDVHFHDDEVIFQEGQVANHFYVVRDGQVALEVFRLDGGPTTIQVLGDGDAFGWSWLVPPYRWRFDARATRDTHAVVFDGIRLRDLCEREPQLGYELLKRFAMLLEQRLQSVRLQLLGIGEAERS